MDQPHAYFVNAPTRNWVWLLLFCLPLSLRADEPIQHDPRQVAALSRELGPESDLRVEDGGILHLHVAKLPSEKYVRIPRLQNPILKVEGAASGRSRSAWTLTPEVDHWRIALPDDTTTPFDVWLTLPNPLQLPEGASPIEANEKGEIVLPAHAATVHGKMLRYEPQPHKNTVGYWVVVDDWVSWSFRAPRAGQYTVHIRQGCGNGHGGSDVVLRLAGQEIPFQVTETGGFQNWLDRELGIVRLREKELLSLEVRAKRIAHGAVMDIQRIELRPRD